ncbi:MAG: hypothetical protein AB7I30_20420 [Isosphaeraceae bacterium]
MRRWSALLFTTILGCWIGLAVPGIAPASSTVQEPSTTLRWKFRKGETFRYELRRKSTIQSRDASKPLTVVNEVAVTLLWTVESVGEDGSAVLRQTIEAARAAIEAGNLNLRFDSKKGSDQEASPNALATLYRAAQAHDGELTIDSRGRILAIVIPDEVTRSLRGSPFQATADGGSVFTERGMRSLLGPHLPLLPEAAVSQRSRWEEPLALPMGLIDLIHRSRLTVKSVESATATLDVVVSHEVTAAKGALLKATLDEGSGSGTIRFDVEAGRLRSSSQTQKLAITLGIDRSTIPQSVLIESSMTLVP